MTTADCPCGSGFALAECCAPCLEGQVHAPTAEALMRSRYTAYVLERFDYLRETWHPATRPAEIAPVPGLHWLGLTIKRVTGGGIEDEAGEVEFIARSKRAGRATRMHETSSFERYGGHWVYTRGVQHPR
jgi:SEC-C motif-containing protein